MGNRNRLARTRKFPSHLPYLPHSLTAKQSRPGYEYKYHNPHGEDERFARANYSERTPSPSVADSEYDADEESELFGFRRPTSRCCEGSYRTCRSPIVGVHNLEHLREQTSYGTMIPGQRRIKDGEWEASMMLR